MKLIVNKNLVLLFFLTGLTSLGWADTSNIFNDYLKEFQRDYSPTMADFEKFYPDQAYLLEDDLETISLIEEAAKKTIGNKALEETELAELDEPVEIEKRSQNHLRPSLYLQWLRTKVPLSPKVTILARSKKIPASRIWV